MSQFILNANHHGKHPFYSLDDFAKGYVEAMFFTNGDTGDEREDLLNDIGVEKLTKKAVEEIRHDCNMFKVKAKDLLDFAVGRDGYSEERAGNDFWFTRQGHGVGFWDRNELKADDLGDKLSEAARGFGEAYVEVSRGWIYYR